MIWEVVKEAYSTNDVSLRVKQVLDAASECNVTAAWAIARRRAFLLSRRLELDDLIDWCVDHDSDDEQISHLITDASIRLRMKKQRVLKEDTKMRDYLKPEPKGSITEEMIAQAKEYPVDQLIDFNKGKAMAWCHADSNPSLTFWKKGNRAVCWPCDKKFNAIDICVERDGMTFIDAVKYLCRS